MAVNLVVVEEPLAFSLQRLIEPERFPIRIGVDVKSSPINGKGGFAVTAFSRYDIIRIKNVCDFNDAGIDASWPIFECKYGEGACMVIREDTTLEDLKHFHNLYRNRAADRTTVVPIRFRIQQNLDELSHLVCRKDIKPGDELLRCYGWAIWCSWWYECGSDAMKGRIRQHWIEDLRKDERRDLYVDRFDEMMANFSKFKTSQKLKKC